MYLITIRGERHEDHIPIMLVENNEGVLKFIDDSKINDWQITWPTETLSGAIDTGPYDDVSYGILLVRPNTPIVRT